MNDPMDPLKRIQQHLDAIRRMQQPHLNISNPRIDASKLTINFTGRPGGPAPMAPPLPEPLVDWLLEDLPPRAFHDFVTETVAALKLKGYRPGHVPRPEGLKALKKRYEKDPIFRARAGSAWLQGRKKEDAAFRLLKGPDVRKDPWPVVERFGFPLAVWLFALSGNGVHRAVAAQVLKDVAAKGGDLEKLLAEARQKAPAGEDLWALPAVGHDDELARIQSEVEGILAERDRWQKEASDEKKRREALEAELKALRGESQKAGQARAAADQGRAALEARVREMENHLETLRGAESVIKRLEKQVKEAEHESRRLAGEKDAALGSASALRAERDALKKALVRSERTAAGLRTIAAAAEPPAKPIFQGQVLLLVTALEPASFFESAKRAGLTLLVHDGRAKNAQFDKFAEQAWKILVWGDPDSFQEGVRGALEDASKPVLHLPALPAALAGRAWGALKNL